MYCHKNNAAPKPDNISQNEVINDKFGERKKSVNLFPLGKKVYNLYYYYPHIQLVNLMLILFYNFQGHPYFLKIKFVQVLNSKKHHPVVCLFL